MSLLLANNKGTDQTAMISKPAYLSVDIVTDKSTSVKISIPQVVSVAEQTGLSLTWSQTQYLCQFACVSTRAATFTRVNGTVSCFCNKRLQN